MSYFKIYWVEEGEQGKDNKEVCDELEKLGVCNVQLVYSLHELVNSLK